MGSDATLQNVGEIQDVLEKQLYCSQSRDGI